METSTRITRCSVCQSTEHNRRTCPQIPIEDTFVRKIEEDPWTGYGPFAAIRDGGKVAIDGLAWAPREDDVNLKRLVLQLLHEHYARVKRVVPARRRCIRAEDRLVRATAINTCGVMSDTSKELPRANPPFLPRTASASHHLR